MSPQRVSHSSITSVAKTVPLLTTSSITVTATATSAAAAAETALSSLSSALSTTSTSSQRTTAATKQPYSYSTMIPVVSNHFPCSHQGAEAQQDYRFEDTQLTYHSNRQRIHILKTHVDSLCFWPEGASMMGIQILKTIDGTAKEDVSIFTTGSYGDSNGGDTKHHPHKGFSPQCSIQHEKAFPHEKHPHQYPTFSPPAQSSLLKRSFGKLFRKVVSPLPLLQFTTTSPPSLPPPPSPQPRQLRPVQIPPRPPRPTSLDVNLYTTAIPTKVFRDGTVSLVDRRMYRRAKAVHGIRNRAADTRVETGFDGGTIRGDGIKKSSILRSMAQAISQATARASRVLTLKRQQSSYSLRQVFPFSTTSFSVSSSSPMSPSSPSAPLLPESTISLENDIQDLEKGAVAEDTDLDESYDMEMCCPVSVKNKSILRIGTKTILKNVRQSP
ncbi:hypothetical protein BX616_002766 [Lobosporangium transversale]|uniref:Uncharacterized protein n=1 Tax=Lobosporangium transversale TaxID=64571 RepID=A0A1Y2GCE8_9FUNG|nr:hypothetical protein BCR41DRAFT_399841 [Lobosporangium transversale]KAF9916806.1 hypothetical protein BX616_002766 [Lobosporangium transversale]ORZ06981.1 hypothetical protein BCR41DRAFT_399841 [Lobosporangium transversale]|eukprot:XP_021877777.1 hypothetical protein BCR41DRAFT_399841 [Lobosporangium transversale]